MKGPSDSTWCSVKLGKEALALSSGCARSVSHSIVLCEYVSVLVDKNIYVMKEVSFDDVTSMETAL